MAVEPIEQWPLAGQAEDSHSKNALTSSCHVQWQILGSLALLNDRLILCRLACPRSPRPFLALDTILEHGTCTSNNLLIDFAPVAICLEGIVASTCMNENEGCL